ncbi:hypothetical protein IAQ61_010829 [Plenodomus lingam]|uniref:uncharacterized protein n=1 Tax=Leptosphaeria maculans TaxID=5022 RepID=UPI0033217D9A|nr:hypothetical protein IAQ61_010829 [Plenodomus lingam]
MFSCKERATIGRERETRNVLVATLLGLLDLPVLNRRRTRNGQATCATSYNTVIACLHDSKSNTCLSMAYL